jgi:NitT/TauT family transport system permease protein
VTNVVRGVLVPLGLLLVWEMAGRLGAIPVDSVSMPSRMWTAGVTLLRDGVGIVFGLFPRVQGVVGPTLEVLRPVPPVAFIPLALLIFGFGVALEVTIIVLASVWPVLIVTVAAVRGIEPRLVEVGRVLELSLARRIKTIVLPATAARIGVGVRIAAGVALVVAITVEIVLNPRGLGYEMIVAQQKLQVDILFALIVWTGCVGVLFNLLVAYAERRWLPRVS